MIARADVLSLIALLAAAGLLIVASHYFRTLNSGLLSWASRPLFFGVLVAIVVFAAKRYLNQGGSTWVELLVPAVALYLVAASSAREIVEGTLIGGLVAVGFIVVSLLVSPLDYASLIRVLLAAIIAGGASSFAQTHRPSAFWWLAAIALSAAVMFVKLPLEELQVSSRTAVLSLAFLVPATACLSVFQRWPLVRRELMLEAKIGIINPREIASVAHPFRRFASSGWLDRDTRQRFVQLATELAIRKRQQRNRSGRVARLYQLEILKLRMKVAEITRIESELRNLDRQSRSGMEASHDS